MISNMIQKALIWSWRKVSKFIKFTCSKRSKTSVCEMILSQRNNIAYLADLDVLTSTFIWMRVKLNIKKIFYKTKIIEKKTKKRKINVCQTKNLEVKAKNLLKKRFFLLLLKQITILKSSCREISTCLNRPRGS